VRGQLGLNGGTNASCSAPLASQPPPPIDGVCGSANGVPVSAAPNTNLCSAGTATAVTGSGPWSWTCAGSNGGFTAACTAPVVSGPPPGAETMGETTAFAAIDRGNRGLLEIQNAQLATAGTLQSLSIYVANANAAGELRLGLYDGSGANGGPGNIIAQTAAFVPVVGWNTQPVASTQLTAGGYWLAYATNSNRLTFSVEYDNGECWWANLSFQAMPATFPQVVGMDQCHWGFYATLSIP